MLFLYFIKIFIVRSLKIHWKPLKIHMKRNEIKSIHTLKIKYFKNWRFFTVFYKQINIFYLHHLLGRNLLLFKIFWLTVLCIPYSHSINLTVCHFYFWTNISISIFDSRIEIFSTSSIVLHCEYFFLKS